MARVIPWNLLNSLPPKTHVWEESKTSGSMTECEISPSKTPGIIVLVRVGDKNKMPCAYTQDANYRYWDSEPTASEIKAAKWPQSRTKKGS